MPSVISAHGPGYRRAIKPDILMPGGRQLFEMPISPQNPISLRAHRTGQITGQQVATPGQDARLDRSTQLVGTSNAAALTARESNFIFELLENLRLQQQAKIPQNYDAVLIRTLLVHGASWGNMKEPYEDVFSDLNPNRRTFREHLTRFLGYGRPDFKRIAAGSDQHVTVIGFASLDDKEAAEFALPLPSSLYDTNPEMRVTITLAWFSPINSQHQKYRVARLWFDVRGNVASSRIYANRHAARRGTLQHEVFDGHRSASIQDQSPMVVKVNCRKDAGDILNPIRFGLAVTLEITQNLMIPIPLYEHVREGLSVRPKLTI